MSGKIIHEVFEYDFDKKTITYIRDPSKQFKVEQEVSYDYIIFKDGEVIKAFNTKTKSIEFQGPDAATVIQSAINALTPNRTWKEGVLLKGDFILAKSGSPQILLPSYIVLKIEGKLTLADGINQPIIQNADILNGNSHIEIRGGILDGNRLNQPTQQGAFGIALYGVEYTDIIGVTVTSTADMGILVRGNVAATKPSKYVRVLYCHVRDTMGYRFALYGENIIAAHNIAERGDAQPADNFNIGGKNNIFISNLLDVDGFAL